MRLAASYYRWIRPLIFRLDAECAHHLAIWLLQKNVIPKQTAFEHPVLRVNLWNKSFPNPIGLAAGFDKNAQMIAPLAKQGFGFIEVGTVTPLPQIGNPKPRLFRLNEDEAIINRMGFNNFGKDAFIQQLKQRPTNMLVGANIGKNKLTEHALDDYQLLLKEVYGLSDYIVINISSPNTPGLRALQEADQLEVFISELVKTKNLLHEQTGIKVPLLLKIDPDGSPLQRQDIAKIALKNQLDGLIVSNTTLQRASLRSKNQTEVGGLSGRPLFEKSTQALKEIYYHTKGEIPLIGVGGVSNAAQAYAKIRAGASLVQVYSALIYQGFSLIPQIQKELVELLLKDGYQSIQQAVGADVN